MKDSNYCFLTIRELIERLNNGEVTSSELVELFYARYQKLDTSLNSFLTYSLKAARDLAAHLDGERKSGQAHGRLHGIPISIKDNIATRGVKTTSGSKIFSSFVPDFDATVVERLKSEGAIILGKNNLAEFAYSVLTENPHYGPVQNPWDGSRGTGGSSGGSAAAVSAGLASASLGSDTGGSIRIPASLCGVVGMKATYGRASLYGITPLAWSMDHVGPIARSAWDAALILEVISGFDRKDPTSSRYPVQDYVQQLGNAQRFTIGVLRGFFFESLDPEVRAAVEKVISLLKELNNIREMDFRDARHLRRIGFLIIASEASSYHRPWFPSRKKDYGKEARERLELGLALSAPEYIDAQRVRRYAAEEFVRVTKGCDVLITPTLPITAPEIGAKEVNCGGEIASPRDLLPRFTTPFNALGLPTITIPIGLSSNDLPIGLQIIGREAFKEPIVFEVADGIEKMVREKKLFIPKTE
jgi:aspartyl-tRNA(Asn)/glutamyl-tRNA(Gln) amidotransferase subunit A